MAIRSLTTILFTDIVGSTERAAELGDLRWRELLQMHHSRMRSLLRRYGGREVKVVGDGFLAAFDSPARGIVCAWSAREELRALGLELRCGLHMGQVDTGEGDVGGMAVHVGARVASLGGSGEILVSRAIHDAEVGSGFRFEDRGTHPLKGVPGEWQIFAVTALPEETRWAPVSWRERMSRYSIPVLTTLAVALAVAWLVTWQERWNLFPGGEAAAETAPGIAVLPFRVSGDGLDDLDEGMVDLLSINLDGAAGLRAIDTRTVLASWKEVLEEDSSQGLEAELEAARDAGARYAVIGSAVGDRGGLRLIADVYETDSEERLGRAEVIGSPDSILALVDRLTFDILRDAFGTELEISEIGLANLTTSSTEALKAYLAGEAHFRKSDWEAAIREYERAIEADSTFALALYRFNRSVQWSSPPSYESEIRAQRLMERYSGRLPPREALLMKAQTALFQESPSMLRRLQEAARQYPDDPEMWLLLGESYFYLAASQHLTATEIDRPFQKAIELDPGFTPAYYYPTALALFFQPDSARALRLITAFTRHAPESKAAQVLPIAFDLTFRGPGLRQVALETIDTLDLDLTWELQGWLYLSTLYPTRSRLLDRLETHPEFAVRTPGLRIGEYIATGRLQELLDRFSSPFSLYLAYTAGMPVPESAIEAAMAVAVSDTIPDLGSFPRGAYAADRGNWSMHAAAVARLQADARRLHALSDSSGAGFLDSAADALRGYGLWRRGNVDEGLARMREAVPRLAGFSHISRGAARVTNSLLQLWVGRVLIDRDRPREAIPYLRALRYDVELMLLAPGRYELASAYEMLGEPDSAAAAYLEFARLWRDADPPLQERVSWARSRAEALRDGKEPDTDRKGRQSRSSR